MKNYMLNKILLVGLITFATCTIQAAEEKELIAILQSEAGAVEQCTACQQLRICGTAKSVPALAALLGAERAGHAARYALEAMPYAEAGAALRNALGRTSGLVKVGLINSLGWRRDTASVPLLVPLLSDADTTTATAAASALGRIGDADAIAALIAARNNSNPQVRNAVLEALLRCAETRLSTGDDSNAAALYRDLLQAEPPSVIRIAAWRGLALSDGDRRPPLVIEALTGSDEQLRLVAIKLVRETKDEQLVRACLQRFKSLPADAQVLLINVLAERGDNAALPDIRQAYKSTEKAVRIAAIKAVGALGDASSVKLLAERAAQTSGDEQAEARESLKVLGGKDTNLEMIRQLTRASTNVRVELITALSQRGATDAAGVLIELAKQRDKAVRLACYKALREVADAKSLAEMVGLLERASQKERGEIERAVIAVAQRQSVAQQASQAVTATFEDADDGLRVSLIRILGQLGVSSSLPAMRRALADDDAQIKYAAIQGLAAWPNAEPKYDLLRIAGEAENATHRVLALRGYIDMIAIDNAGDDEKLRMYEDAMALASSSADAKKVLSGVSGIKTLEALKMVRSRLGDAAIRDEAAFAAIRIAKAIYARHPRPVKEAMQEIVESKAIAGFREQAAEIIGEIDTVEDYLMDWQVSGPYVREGKNYAGLHDIEFAPENDPAAAEWRQMPLYADVPHTGYIDLLRALDGGHQRVAYLRTTIDCAEARSTSLDIFSDDGVKVWLNGKVVHSHNIARPIPPQPDRVKVAFKKGGNELMLKVTQNNMPWGVIVRTRVDRPQTAKVGDGFKVHVVNADSKFEAAGILDVNNDGKLDIFCGDHWYEGPTWKKHFVRQVQYDGNYYYDFANIPIDVDGDGWVDIVNAAWHNKMVFWVRNPGKAGGEWPVIEVDTPGNMETALAVDIDGDGKTDILPNIMSAAAWYEYHPDAEAENGARWVKHPLPEIAKGHGIGAGDINGDGRCDVVAPRGWLEQPAEIAGEWKWHGEFDLGHCSIPALVHDVDGDKDADIIWGFGHAYGLFWLEQRQSDGKRIWARHSIDDSWSQPHFMLLADLDNDGVKELVTGKRYHAHNGKDPGGNDPKCIYYYTFDRQTRKWNRHLIHEGGSVAFGINTQAADIDGDGDIDIVAPGKSGLYLLENLLK